MIKEALPDVLLVIFIAIIVLLLKNTLYYSIATGIVIGVAYFAIGIVISLIKSRRNHGEPVS